MTRNPAQTVVILPAERAVRIDGETRQIGARAFDVLAYLDAHSGRVVTKAELLENVWADLNVEESNLTVQIAALRKMIGARAIATVPGVGYRRIHVLLRREGWQVNIKKTRRIYNELGLQLRNKRPKRRVQAKLRDDCQEAVGPNDVWAMDFVHDQLALGNKPCILTIVDTHSRLCPATDARFTYRGEDLVQTLESVCRRIGYPRTIGVDNGSEFISRDLDLWAYANAVTLDFSRPGKPTDNGFIEAFNSKLRSECLNAHWFMILADAREKLETWRRHYNEDRPHSAIGYNAPITMHYPGCAASPSL